MGGLRIPWEFQTAGHSDADVLLHALTDALLGAAGLGDIGEWFPDDAEVNRGRDSAEFLQAAVTEIAAKGWSIVNVDCIVFAERPKLKPFKAPMTERLAELLQVSSTQVNIKAKTGEGVDAVGRLEAIQAQVVVLLNQREAT